MYSLYLDCDAGDLDLLSGGLWEAGTQGIREVENGRGGLTLIAGFQDNSRREELLTRFVSHSPKWKHEPETDWVKETQNAWPGREAGTQFFLAAPWTMAPTPPGRMRIIHNPGLACGTGEHPCTQLALTALERYVTPGCLVADIGTGSGILAIAALRLGAHSAIGIDTDEAALEAARANFELNGLPADLIAGSVDCLPEASADLTVANISATVLLALADDLLRMTRPDGRLILTGFPDSELAVMQEIFPAEAILQLEGWSCLISKPS
ncbi:MAG: 50S ribosomal protein L11 methyltransferase [Acidobacteriota bacterium]|nr:50S ribosomal protein L11 methyltransferase [Acidobacteriota bacterium]